MGLLYRWLCLNTKQTWLYSMNENRLVVLRVATTYIYPGGRVGEARAPTSSYKLRRCPTPGRVVRNMDMSDTVS